ncbi:flavodoxin [Clostridium sp. 'White wine YQ']|uniref:flavodoxin n=1 Tax=Clostridium sp. 'White wine YQ' TaxID=3027474 RepID=UPI002365740C|nr:flavodoxin [Clostridium sp. 'White wine YQ']MDD7792862.1 flavodoxin [Clostridium sp. 'White wine YQ']
MKKVSIIYWSNGGNVEVLANAITEGAKEAGAEVLIKHVADAKVSDITEADSVALGSPSMDNNRIEQKEMEPFVNEFKLLPNGNKKLVLFGSYGWDNGAFMQEWSNRMKSYDFNVIGELAVKESPDQDELDLAKEFGRKLAE